MDEDKMWNAVASVVAVGADVASKPVLVRGRQLVTGSEPPGNPAHEDVSWRDAVLWAVITGAVVGLVRLLAQRSAAGAWQKSQGHYPPSLRSTRP